MAADGFPHHTLVPKLRPTVLLCIPARRVSAQPLKRSTLLVFTAIELAHRACRAAAPCNLLRPIPGHLEACLQPLDSAAWA